MSNTLYYSAMDIAGMLGVSRGQAYKIIKVLNEELSKKGYLVVSGKISRRYFSDRYYGGVDFTEREVK